MRRKLDFVYTYLFRTIRSAIVFPVSVYFVVGTIIISFIVLGGCQLAINNSIAQLQRSAAGQVKQEIVFEVQDAVDLASQHAYMFQNSIVDFNNIKVGDRYFVASLKNHPYAIMNYIGYPNKEFYGARRDKNGVIYVVHNNKSTIGNSEYYHVDDFGEATELFEVLENYDLTTRPWYKSAVSTGKVNISSPYSHFVFKQPTITASIPVYDIHNDLRAVFGVDILITGLGEMIKNMPIGEHGEVIITNAQNQIIALTTGESEFKVVDEISVNALISESSNPITLAVADINNGFVDGDIQHRDINGLKYSINSVEMTDYDLNWRIYTLLAESDFNTKAQDFVKVTIFIAFGSLILFIVFFMYITKLIVRPIQKLNKATQQLVEGEFYYIPESLADNEVATLTHNFNRMGEQLTDLVRNLEQQVYERTKELEKKNQMLNDLSYVDPLTNLPNRRKLFEYAELIFKTASRTNQPIALLMLDIDWFKDYNDNYGHIEGDNCLKAIGERLSTCIRRESDLCARYGGEEFVVILQVANEETAFTMANCIREKVQQMSIEHSFSPFSVVTVSVGVYFGPIRAHDRLEQIINKADIALYDSKSKGRNQISFYDQNTDK